MVQPADIALAVRQSTVADVDQTTVPARRRRRSTGPGGEMPT
jgi:hypothetical protein